jgi:hypothetical protein
VTFAHEFGSRLQGAEDVDGDDLWPLVVQNCADLHAILHQSSSGRRAEAKQKLEVISFSLPIFVTLLSFQRHGLVRR